MLWLLLLHISAVVCWCGSLLYLPSLITGTAYRQTDIVQEHRQTVTFMVYRLISTPAALIAIASGTALFLSGGITGLWLVLKLALVAALVLCHVLSGALMLFMWKMTGKSVVFSCLSLRIAGALLIPAIVWLVLTKPL
jgi:putative membrane protein